MKLSRLLALAAVPSLLSAATLTVATDRPGADINPAMWGVFFEDINFGADGGLYAELVKNRGFEFPEPLMGWTVIHPPKAQGRVTVRDDAPFNARNPHYVRLESANSQPFGLSNGGFRGIGVRAGAAYDFAARVRLVAGAAPVRVVLYAENGVVLADEELPAGSAAWSERRVSLRPTRTDAHARVAVLLRGAATVDLDFVSLFPQDTWRGRPGGLRADMVQALHDLGPGFLRFPGGCIVEGSTLDLRYRWKDTLGPVEERPLLLNRWNNEFPHRPTPDYFQSFGLGFYEYFLLCEDIGAQPLPILNCGMACQFNSGELAPLDQLDPYIQDALDLIEFANGPVTSTWGAKRAALGHPEPFHLRLLGVGNEQWGPDYIARYERFAAVLHARHPDISLVAAAGPEPADARFKFAWEKLRALKADIVDEHCYSGPGWFLDNAHRYDNYDRNGPKVFMGEYAAQSVATVSPDNRNTLRCALAEAAFLTGLERNADVVRMASYAPLFAHVDAWQWTPDLIWTDNLHTTPTANYHVQRLFARNRGDRVLPVTLSDLAGEEATRLYASAVRDAAAKQVIVKLVNATAKDSSVHVDLGSAKTGAGTLTVLRSGSPEDFNTTDQPNLVAPQESPFTAPGPKFALTVPANSFVVLRLTTP